MIKCVRSSTDRMNDDTINDKKDDNNEKNATSIAMKIGSLGTISMFMYNIL